jgi:hypothetical protein
MTSKEIFREERKIMNNIGAPPQHPSKYATHFAPLDQIVWLTSPWIKFLTSQHVQGKYAILFLYFELHFSFSRSRKKRQHLCLSEEPNTNLSD